MVVSVDFETFYSKDYSIQDLDTWAYTHHPEFDPYLVSIVSSGGQKFCGDPREFDWGCIAKATWVSHNRSFDRAVYKAAIERGLWAGPMPPEWHCTADLAAFLGLPRALDKVMWLLYGVQVDKNPRSYMKGRRWAELTQEKREELTAYCLHDSEFCVRIWMDHGHKWPEAERWISNHTTLMGERGVPVNLQLLDSNIEELQQLICESLRQIPWAESDMDKPLAPKEFALFCRTKGVEPPASVAMDSEECGRWMEANRTTNPECVRLLEAQRVYRRANATLKKLKAMRTRVKPDGFMSYSLKYFGGHTGRDSGGGGVNTQNLDRKAKVLGLDTDDGRMESSFDIRGILEAPEGYMFVVSDLGQIEPRVMRWLANDQRVLELLRNGMDPYETFARLVLGYSDPRPLRDVDKDLRAICKQAELSLGYGVGAVTYQRALESSERPVVISMAEAQKTVDRWRAANQVVIQMGKRMERDMRKSHGGHYSIGLPSGRELHYWRVSAANGGLTAQVPNKGNLQETGWYWGKLVENLVQAVARDVFMHCVRLIEGECGIPILMRVHDEVVCLARESEAQEVQQQVERCMTTPPEWARSLPVACESHIVKRYTK